MHLSSLHVLYGSSVGPHFIGWSRSACVAADYYLVFVGRMLLFILSTADNLNGVFFKSSYFVELTGASL